MHQDPNKYFLVEMEESLGRLCLDPSASFPPCRCCWGAPPPTPGKGKASADSLPFLFKRQHHLHVVSGNLQARGHLLRLEKKAVSLQSGPCMLRTRCSAGQPTARRTAGPGGPWVEDTRQARDRAEHVLQGSAYHIQAQEDLEARVLDPDLDGGKEHHDRLAFVQDHCGWLGEHHC